MSFCPGPFAVMLWRDTSSPFLIVSAHIDIKTKTKNKSAPKSFLARLNELMFNALCPSCYAFCTFCVRTVPHLPTLSLSHSPKYIVTPATLFLLSNLCQYILLLATKVIAVQTSETILQHMVMQCFKRPQKKQSLLPQKCAFASNC